MNEGANNNAANTNDAANNNGSASSTRANNSNQQTGSNNAAADTKGKSTGGTEANNSDNTSIEKLIQAAVDRATNKLGNENKKLRTQLDELVKKQLTDDERIELERKQEREAFEQEKAQFMQEKHELYAINALSKAEFKVEADKLQTLIPLVMGADENAINNNVKALSDIVKSLVASEVENTFKQNGRNPSGSGNPDNGGDKQKSKGELLAERLGKERTETEKRSRDILDRFTKR